MAYGMELDGADISSYTYMVLLQSGTRTTTSTYLGSGIYWQLSAFNVPLSNYTYDALQSYIFIGNSSGQGLITHCYYVGSPPQYLLINVWTIDNQPTTFDYRVVGHPKTAPPPTGFGAVAYDDTGAISGRLDLPFINVLTQPLIDTPSYNTNYSFAYGGAMSHASNGGVYAYYTGTATSYYLEGPSRKTVNGVTTYRYNRIYMAFGTTPNINTRPPLFLSMITN